MMLISFLNNILWSFLDIVWLVCFVWEVMRFFTPLVSVFKMIFHMMFFHMNLMFLIHMKFCIKFSCEIFCIECVWYYLLSTLTFFVFHMKMLCYFIWHMIQMKSYMHASPLDGSSYSHFSFEISWFFRWHVLFHIFFLIILKMDTLIL